MTTSQRTASAALTLPFDKFWSWLQAHANCILRAGTPDAILFDQDEYHWHLASEEEATLLVQLVKGKDLIGEIVVLASEIAYVNSVGGDGEEFVFECVVETPSGREVAYHFVMTHEYDAEEPSSNRRWTH